MLLILLNIAMLMTSGAPCIAAAKPVSAHVILEASLRPFKGKTGIEIPFQKKTMNTLIGKERKSDGKLFVRSGLFRVEINPPEKSLVVMDGKTLWLENSIEAQQGIKILVTKASSKKLQKTSTVIGAILDSKKILKEFKILKQKKLNDEIEIELAPRKKDSEIQSLTLRSQVKGHRLTRVTYLDDKENQVEFTLGQPAALSAKSNLLFRYTPPKNAEITEL